MRSKSTLKADVRWSLIEQQISQLLYATGVIPDNHKVLALKLDYSGGYVANDKIIPVEIITEEEVDIIRL